MVGTGAGDHTAQTGVGVNDKVPGCGDRKMELLGSGAEQEHVTGEDVPIDRYQAKGWCQAFDCVQLPAAQSVAVGERRVCTDGHCQYADTVEPVTGIAAMQSKRGAYESRCCVRNFVAGHEPGVG